jgi:hypothetical protein
MLLKNEFETCKEATVAYLRQYPSNLEELRNITNNLNQESRPLGQEHNPEPSEYIAEVVTALRHQFLSEISVFLSERNESSTSTFHHYYL